MMGGELEIAAKSRKPLGDSTSLHDLSVKLKTAETD